MKRLLILSNNVLSQTNNNGKTLYSFIKGQDIEVFQLYLSGEVPRIDGYQYFRITDRDILRGITNKKNRGKTVQAGKAKDVIDDFSIKKRVGRNQFTLLVRDLIWHGRWKSKQLDEWLETVSPDALFFVAGDTLFSYELCEYIYSKFAPRLTVYVTDDYVMHREKEGFLHNFRRKEIAASMESILSKTSCFYTISALMRDEYKTKFGFDSNLIVNVSENLRDLSYEKKEKEIVLTYTGSFYYGRSEVLIELAKAIKEYNGSVSGKKAKLFLYSNREPNSDLLDSLCIDNASEYGGSLNSEQLKERLNTSDILVFVESFEPEQIEKVKYSLSTKVPEYMSTGKPILAIGPDGIGSMDYLTDVACCVHQLSELRKALFKLMEDANYIDNLGNLAYKKYTDNHNAGKLREQFYFNVIGGAEKKSENG